MAWIRCMGGNGGGGSSIDTVLSAGQISTTSSYATATFNDISGYKYIFLKVYFESSGVESAGYMIINVDDIPTTGEMGFSIRAGSLDISIKLSRTSIRSDNYSQAAFIDIYADISATNEEIFT